MTKDEHEPDYKPPCGDEGMEFLCLLILLAIEACVFFTFGYFACAWLHNPT